MTDIKDTVVWFSLALDYGLSFVSLGKPGTQGADAQLITGGLTAVEALLGTEIGAKQDGFIVDHGTSLMERFPIKTDKETSVIFAQFLLQATIPGEQVDRSQIPIARKFISELAKSISKTQLWEDLQISAQLISPLQLYDYIIPVYQEINREFKLKPIGNIAEDSIKMILEESFKSYDFSEILHKLASVDIKNIDSYLVENKSNLMNKYSKEVIAKYIQEFPLIFLYTSPKFINQEAEKFISSFLSTQTTKITEDIIYELIKDFFENSMHDVMQEFDIDRIRDDRDQIRNVISLDLRKTILKKYPLLYLANPSLGFKGLDFETIIDKKVLDKVFIEYDLGEVLSKIAGSLVLKANDNDQLQSDLVSDFIRNLGLRFPGGLPPQLWYIIIQLLKIYSIEAKVDLLTINENLDIPDVHWATVKQKFEQFKPSPVLQFQGESGAQVIHFFEGVREAIGRSFDRFYNEFIWNIKDENYGNYFKLFNEECTRIFQSFLTTRHLIAFLNTLVGSNKFKLMNPLSLILDYDGFIQFLNKIEYKGSQSKRLFSGFSEYDNNSIVKFLHYKSELNVEMELKKLQSSMKSIDTYYSYLIKFGESIKETELKSFSKLKLRESNLLPFPNEINYFDEKEIEKLKKEIEKLEVNIFLDVKNKFNEFSTELEKANLDDSKNYSKLIKKKEKLADSIAKVLEKGKFGVIQSGFEQSIGQIKKELDIEFELATKEYLKSIEKEGIKQLKLGIKNGKVLSNDENLENIKNLYLKEENKKYKGDIFIKDTDFLYAFSSAYLFDTMDPNISKKAINLAIFDAKKSKLIQEVIERGKAERKETDSKVIDFLGHLKQEIIETGTEIFGLSRIIVIQIKKSIISEDFPLKVIQGQYDLLTLPIGSLDESFKIYVENKVQIHPMLHLSINEKSGKVDVSFEVSRMPSVGKDTVYLMDAIAINVYNNELLRMGSYIESLKLVSSSLGENERRRIQKLFDTLGSHLTS